MAIIIQDMYMPEQCSQCPFGFRIDNAHTACSINPMENPVEDGDERPKHCPLKEIKQENNMQTLNDFKIAFTEMMNEALNVLSPKQFEKLKESISRMLNDYGE